MAKAAPPVLATDEITFELERFELIDGQLELTGRWFGVRGRRFVRPTLTPLGGRDLSRVLADLEHKPWAPEGGGVWQAAFPWERNGISTKFELAVAPDIVIQLPSPRAKLTLPRRIAALPRPSLTTPAWPHPPAEQIEAPAEPPPHAEVEPEVKVLAEPIRDREAELTLELEQVRAELDTAVAARDAAAEETSAARDAVAAEAARAAAAHDELAALQAAHAELEAAYDELASERDRLTADVAAGERARAELRSELERSAIAVQEAARERDQAISAHGAAMVMRRAAHATPYHSREHSIWREALAVVALIVVVFGILIVVHVL